MIDTLSRLVRQKGARGREATVEAFEDLSPRIRRVRLVGLEGLSWVPGQKVKLVLPNGKASYTPARLDAEAGWMEVIFHLHDGNGALATWAAGLKGGESIAVMGPKKSMPAYEHDVAWALFLGDETALGLAQALLETLSPEVSVLGAVESDAEDLAASARLGLPLAALARSGGYGDVLRGWLDATTLPEGPGVIWLSGHAGTVFGLRDVLLERGVPAGFIKLKAYWSDKGHAHRKLLERSG